MDFEWTAEHHAFRARLKAFMKAQLPADWDEKSLLDPSEPYVAEFGRKFCQALAKEKLLIPHWPKEVGGEGLDPYHHWILGEEMFAAGEPRAYQYMSVNWVGPAILQYGSPEQIKTLVGGITSGRDYWCQGFSEPNAGSDLAAMRTKADKTANGWVINGSKIWTSAASVADYCFLLARTGDSKRNISVFIVPMKTPGVVAKVIPGVSGAQSFHEVFFTNVEVSDADMLGPEGQGWKVMKHVLQNERIGAPRYALAERAVLRGIDILKKRGRFKDSGVKSKAMRAIAGIEAARYQALEVIDARAKGREMTAKINVARYALVLADRATADFLGDCLNDVVVAKEDIVIYAAYRRTSSSGLGAGTAEIQLNTIARDYLELPRD
jgi:alkylation response protein AidB-like acyl-CoA dehydrogenase